MAKRAHIRLVISILKWIFWITLIYGIYIFFTIHSSKDLHEEQQSQHHADPQPALQKAGIENPPLQTDADLDKPPEQDDVPDESIDENNPQTEEKSDDTEKSIIPPPNVCPDLSFPSDIAATNAWQPVDTSNSMYVYSAYYVAEKHMVYIIGVRPKAEVSVMCQIWYQQEGETPIVIDETKAEVQPVTDDKGHRYAPTVFQCISEKAPAYVSLVKKTCRTPLNALQVRSASKSGSHQRRLTVCVPPTTKHLRKTNDFVKWIEINTLYGVQMFVMYNYSANANLSRIMKHYEQKGLVQVVQWRPPMIVNEEEQRQNPQIWKYGEVAALNDCLFRNKRSSDYITNIAVSEFLIPHASKNVPLDDTVRHLDEKAPAFHISMTFRKRHRHGNPQQGEKETDKEQEDEQEEDEEEKKPVTVRPLTKEEMRVHQERKVANAKLIIRTSDVDFALVNSVPGIQNIPVPHGRLLMHRFPGGGSRQRLGHNIDDILPSSLINQAKSNADKLLAKVQDSN